MLFWVKKRFFSRLTAMFVFLISVIIIMGAASVLFKSPYTAGDRSRVKAVWEGNHLRNQFANVSNERLMKLDLNFACYPKKAVFTILKHPLSFLITAIDIYPKRIIGYLSAYQFGFFDLVYLVNSAKVDNNFMPTLEFYFTIFFFIYLYRSS